MTSWVSVWPPPTSVCAVSDEVRRKVLLVLQRIQSATDCGRRRADQRYPCAEALPKRKRMLRYVLVLSLFLPLGVAAGAAASAADAPAVGQVAFLVCLGLFGVALAGGVVDRRMHRPKVGPARGAR